MTNAIDALRIARRLEPQLNAFSALYESFDSSVAGMAFAAKDVFDVAGRATYCGNASAFVERATETAPAVQRLLDVGMRLIGKTTMPQFAYGGWGTNALVGPPRNPWDAAKWRIAGGSSSGSAVVVAAGIVQVALGTDTGGSVRIPASLCGVVGFKPRRRRISDEGVHGLAPTLDTVGLLAHDVATARSVHAILAPGLKSPSPRPRRVAVARMRSEYGCEPCVTAALNHSAHVLRERGFEIVEVDLPWEPCQIIERSSRILSYEAWQSYGAFCETTPGDAMDPIVAHRLRTGRSISRDVYEIALEQRAREMDLHRAWLEEYAALLTPTTPITARELNDVDESSLILSTFTRAGTYLDLCALSLPAGWDHRGLPIGVQLLANPDDDDGCLSLAADLESGLDLEIRRPPIS